ncbi:MAG: porin [Pseudomonadota bacterium]
MKRLLLAPALLLAAGTAPLARGAEPTLEDLQKQIEALAAEIEAQKKPSGTSASGGGKTTLGGYGEHHFNNLDSKNQVDAHRFVLFIGHQFDEKIRLFSELEVEHGLVKDNGDATCTVDDTLGAIPGTLEPDEVICGSSKGAGPGEVELEQAFIEFRLTDAMRLKAGQFLIPVGFLNETHEPDTFYGVERNPIEGRIIPTTWWETGVMLSGEATGTLSYDLAFHTGLKNSKGNIRSGRQKSANADGSEWAATARVKFRPLESLELAATVQQQADMAQRGGAPGEPQEATLANAQFSWQPLEKLNVRGLYGQWTIDNLATADEAAEEQNGWYVETSYRVLPKVGVFARYNLWDNAAADSNDSEVDQTDLGVNWWPHPRVVVKADYQEQNKNQDDDGYNLGIGWSF